jgi:hypothetical protein
VSRVAMPTERGDAVDTVIRRPDKLLLLGGDQ